ncbi:nucleic acid-binding protein [Melanomma pulvis-pyrius CBS 109.77]|uniref:Nucleic acid-binding protein n=1 Tax=Melanomma pulvis-pyrius CBS 109.77 TaxID=1314802 RepID=A0A6A6WRE6_9PLEO|nr:nucleic acid-binding protein [Melanomma pulvis-pyrius CBS 109.77]
MFSSTFRVTSRLASVPTTRAFSSTPRASLARMSIIGRLGTVPEEVTISNDKTLVRYVIGSSYGKGDDKKTSWFRVASFVTGGQKDFLMNVQKGSLLYVDADARMDVYTDNEGNKKSSLNLIARNFEVLSRPQAREETPETNDEGLVHESQA